MGRLAELQKTRRDLGWVMFYYLLVAVPLTAIGLIVSWGAPAATFLMCLIGAYEAYHFVQGVHIYKAIKHEEDRVRRALALSGKDVE